MATRSPLLSFLSRSIEHRPSSRVASNGQRWQTGSLAQTRGAKTATTLTRKEKTMRKKKKYPNFKLENLNDAKQYTLCDAMQYLRAFEVGRPSNQMKYELAVRLKTRRDGPIIRNQLRLPYSVKTDIKICAICAPDSKAARDAREAGATMVGEDEVFEVMKSGKFDFDRVVAHPDSMQKLSKAGLPRILGPRGLMPSPKMGTVVENMKDTIGNMLGGSMYRERDAVLRLSIGQLGFTPEQLRDNIRTFVAAVRKDASAMSDSIQKDIHEVILSSTNGPGFILTGEFSNPNSVSVKALSTS